MIRLAQVEDALAIARVHVDTWRTSYVGIVPEEHLANLSYERSQAGWTKHLSDPRGETCTFVAERESGQIVGFALGGALRDALSGFDGELYAIYVSKPFQGLGYGRRLVTHVACDLAGRGYHALVIWVLEDNGPARRFYERLGGRLGGEKIVEIGGKPLTDVAYLWPDIGVFRPGRTRGGKKPA